MSRYGVFSVTGYPSPLYGGSLPPPPTIWYVYDSAACAEIVSEHALEGTARYEAFKRNAEERRWEKEQERAVLAARNGHS